MAKKKTKSKDRRARQPQRRTVRTPPPPSADAEALADADAPVGLDQDMLDALRSRWRSQDPYELLALTSDFVLAADPRQPRRRESEQEQVSLSELVDPFLTTSYAETTATLHIMRVLIEDETQIARIDQELARRRQRMPTWITGLAAARMEPDVWMVTDAVGSGASYLFSAKLSPEWTVTASVYIDDNLGGIAKNGFVAMAPMSDLIEALPHDDPDMIVTTADPATARAVLERALDIAARRYSAVGLGDWPRSRPLIEWLARLMPSGGSVPTPDGWSAERLAELADDFFASSLCAGLDDHDHRELLKSVLSFAGSQGNHDPLRWGGSRVEILLLDWFPGKVAGAPAFLDKLPALLRAYIRFAHARAGMGRDATADALDSVDAYADDFQWLIHDSRPHEPAALLTKADAGRSAPPTEASVAYESDLFGAGTEARERVLHELLDAVGGQEQLSSLNDVPLPDEPFVWATVPEDIRVAVDDVLSLTDRCADDLLDVEHRTAMRRLVHRAAVGDPELFRRRSSAVRAAASIAWVVCKANGTIGSGRGAEVSDLLSWFGLSGGVSQRAAALVRAVGVEPAGFGYAPHLGAPDLLVSSRREQLIERRDRLFGG